MTIPKFDWDRHFNKDGSPKETPYEILGIPKDATQKEVRDWYRKKAQEFHPDKNPTQREDSEKWFKLINSAYEILSDPTKRSEYDSVGYKSKFGDSYKSENWPKRSTGEQEYIKFWAGESLGAGVPLSRFDKRFEPFDSSLGSVFRGVSAEELETKEAKDSYLEALKKWGEEKDKIDSSAICYCDKPFFPDGYRPGEEIPHCFNCHKPVSWPQGSSLGSGTEEYGEAPPNKNPGRRSTNIPEIGPVE